MLRGVSPWADCEADAAALADDLLIGRFLVFDAPFCRGLARTHQPSKREVAALTRVLTALGGPSKVNLLLTGHSHFDHSFDTATWSKLTSANIIGSRTTCLQAEAEGIPAAIRRHDTATLFDWLIAALSYQGISDQVAAEYMERHGRTQWADIDVKVAANPTCPKLASYWHFHGCRYDKLSRTLTHGVEDGNCLCFSESKAPHRGGALLR